MPLYQLWCDSFVRTSNKYYIIYYIQIILLHFYATFNILIICQITVLNTIFLITFWYKRWEDRVFRRLERVAPSSNSKGEKIRADITHPDLLAQVVLDDGHLLGWALGAQQPPTMTAMMSPGCQTKLSLQEVEYSSYLSCFGYYLTLLTAVPFSPPWFLRKKVKEPE